MVDLQTLMISLLVIEGLLAILMLGTSQEQKKYPGYNIWSVSLVVLTISSVFLLLRGIIQDFISIFFGNLLFLLGLLLMAESLHRFFTGTPLNRWVYGMLLPVSILISYFTLAHDDISMRSLVISISSILIIIIILQIIRKYGQKGNCPSRYLSIVLFIFAGVSAFRGIEWFIRPIGRNLYESTTLNVGLYVMGIISVLTITFMYLLLHFHRLADELQESDATTNRLLYDLDVRNRDLDQKVQERTEKIENLLLQKDQFINQIAHDLRTPLTPLVALVPLLKQGFRDKESVELLSILEKNVNYLRNMTEQLIKLANLNSQGSITDLNERILAGLIHDAISINSVPIEENQISIEIHIPDHMRVCVSKIYGVTIFSNIIHNAIKYNVKSGHITITGSEEDDMIAVTITDNGIGMDNGIIEKIWDELYVCDTSRSDPISKGLGLSMVRKLVTLHGGHISAMSPGLGKGSTFIVRLPRYSSPDLNHPA